MDTPNSNTPSSAPSSGPTNGGNTSTRAPSNSGLASRLAQNEAAQAKAPAPKAPPAPAQAKPTPTPTQTQQLADQGSTAATQAKQQLQQEVKKEEARRKYQLKVDGQVHNLELNDAELTARLQKSLAAEKRMAESATFKKQFEQFATMFDQDPLGAAKLLGKDPSAVKAKMEQLLAEEYMGEKLKEQNPIEYERNQARKEVEQYKAQVEAFKQQEQQRLHAEHSAKAEAQLTQQFVETLEKSGLPKNRRAVAMMAEVMKQELAGGYQLTPEQRGAEVRDRIREDAGYVLKEMRGQGLIDFLGDSVVREVIAHSLKKVKAAQAQPAAQVQNNEPQYSKNNRRDLTDIPERIAAPRRSDSLNAWKKVKLGR